MSQQPPRARRLRRALVHQTADPASTIPNPDVHMDVGSAQIGVRGISESEAVRLATAGLLAATSLTGAAIGASASKNKGKGAAVGGLLGLLVGVTSLAIAGA